VVAIGPPPAGALRKLPNLGLIVSLTAGIDALFRDPDLPAVPIVRTGDPNGDTMMNETTLLHVLRHHRYMRTICARGSGANGSGCQSSRLPSARSV
jgi:glyoxylate/hydroxypyruvate reductase A